MFAFIFRLFFISVIIHLKNFKTEWFTMDRKESEEEVEKEEKEDENIDDKVKKKE